MGPSNTITLFDPLLARDFFVKNAESQDKASVMQRMFANLLGESFLFAKGDEKWKLKRKVCGPAFYKERLHNLIECMKVVSRD